MSGVTGILLCAGESRRLGFHKLVYRLPNGKTPMSMSLEALIRGGVDKIIIVVNEATRSHAEELASRLGVPSILCRGGDTRQESVFEGLKHVSSGIALIHDAARCMVRPGLVRACIDSARLYGSGVAAIPVRDTVLLVNEGGAELGALPREKLLHTQTPQVFKAENIIDSYALALKEDRSATDDSTLYAAAGNTVRFVPGSVDNRKLTTAEDLTWLEEQVCAAAAGLGCQAGLRVGCGEDVHLLKEGRALVLGGVPVPFEKGLLGHSDADVLTHALMDALLGAAGLGDIGLQFPDSDEKYKDISSLSLLKLVGERLSTLGYGIRNVDITVVAQKPMLAPYFPMMRGLLSKALNLDEGRIGLKATTTEGTGPEGRGECMRANAVALLYTL
ncbi:MAG TPA: 2-C-methyl-D-erythritol 2,4-cyclodiphosphate synthase [Clostridia bacterium]|nr:2-C-methyl-D-erythritol 2,4-cyclodiphosphate synthase [Clostridia bacterium]HOR13617.1 2-C-methyl-D-erythritol 2,4-cyclodiphosphate synthase [Clostridia bacterium]